MEINILILTKTKHDFRLCVQLVPFLSEYLNVDHSPSDCIATVSNELLY